MKNSIIVPMLIRSLSSLRHRVYCILSLELGWSCVFLTTHMATMKNNQVECFTMEKGASLKTEANFRLPTVLGVGVPQRNFYFSRRPTPSKHFPWSSSVTFDLWFKISKMALFECCSKQFVKDTGRSTLHPIVDLNSSSRCDVLCVVVKKRSRWCWKKAKYLPTQFSLNEIMTKVSCHFVFHVMIIAYQ